jgi:hypothetical protein
MRYVKISFIVFCQKNFCDYEISQILSTQKISFMRKILLLVLIILLLQQATLAQNTWNGNTNTDWNTGTNWSTSQAPTASDDVVIAASGNQPLISTAGAVAKSVLVQSGAMLTIGSAGSLAVNGSGNTAFSNAGTVDNSGQLLIGNLSAAGNYGLRNDATFNNNTGGQITIDNTSIYGLYNAGGTFTNASTITIGAVAGVGLYGVANFATFNNNTGGQITIDRSATIGLYNLSGSSFTNAAAITIGGTAGVGAYGLENDAMFNNNTGGQIKLDNSSTYGLNNAGTFTNAATITIGAVSSTGIYGVANFVTFNNNTGGQITIDRSTTIGLYNLAGGSFTNAAAITIGGTESVGAYGLENDATFNNNTGGQITIDNTSTYGLYNAGTLSNAATITIGAVAGVGLYDVANFATFNNNTGGQISIDRSTTTGLYNFSGSSFTNAAAITIGGTAGVGAYGLENDAMFNNNTGGQITIDNSSTYGLINAGTFTNTSTVTIGAVAGVGIDGVANFATFNNNTGGQISIDRSTTAGLYNLPGSSFTNGAAITIGAATNVGNYGLENDATFNNNTGGQITIDNASIYGLYNAGGSFTNAATITVGAVAGVGINGLFNAATFNNNTGGQISIDRSTSIGLYNQGGSFTNADAITIGAAAGIGNYGLENDATFDNTTGGQIKLDNISIYGLYNAGGTLTNEATITIGAVTGAGIYGLLNAATFNNNTGGQITIDRSTAAGLYNIGGSFTNAATITIGAAAGVGNYGLQNDATFDNSSCAVLTLFAPMSNTGNVTNEGLFTLNTSGAHANSGFTNNGILVYPQGNPVPNVTNQALIVVPLSGCTAITPALEIGNSNPFTVGSTWYQDQALTQPAGTFTIGDNTFTATGLSTGSTTVYFTINNGGTCTQTVAIPVTLFDGCNQCPNATDLNTTQITAQSARLKWIALSDPAKWEVQYKMAIPGNTWTNIRLAGPRRSIEISSLTADQNYRWRIRAKCGTTWNTFSAVVNFKTPSAAPLSTGTQQAASVEEEKSFAIKLYPNPTTGQFMIELHLPNEINTNAEIQLVNMVGQTVSAENANISNGLLQKTVSISSSLTSGIYMVKVVVGDKIYVSKLVYEK